LCVAQRRALHEILLAALEELLMAFMFSRVSEMAEKAAKHQRHDFPGYPKIR
jgi:hypothetical protein